MVCQLNLHFANDFNFHIFFFQTEASIYALYSIAEHVEVSEQTCIPKFVRVLSSIPYDKLNEKLLDTALEAIGMQ